MGLREQSTTSAKTQIKSKDYVLNFGKYKGNSIDDIMEIDPKYLMWLHENNSVLCLSSALFYELEEIIENWDNYDYGDYK